MELTHMPLMRTVQAERPALLMLSHCLPDGGGTQAAARAWQLLRLASRSHRVFLACVADRPVRLDRWRAAAALAKRVAMEPPPTLRGLAARWLGPAAPAAAQRLAMAGALAAPVANWARELRFAVVLATHPALWEQAVHAPAARRACDLDLIVPDAPAGAISAAAWSPIVARIAAEADVVAVSELATRDLPTLQAVRRVVVPSHPGLVLRHAERLERELFAPPDAAEPMARAA